MDAAKLTSLLAPFLAETLSPDQTQQFLDYLALLQKWSSRINLTAIRQEDEIVTRHFGESLFAAHVLRDGIHLSENKSLTMLDLGSGAGFPGLPIRILLSQLSVMLAESQHKKAAFLSEAIRTLKLTEARVHAGRAETLQSAFDVVTLRAVDSQQQMLTVAASLLNPGGSLLFLCGEQGLTWAKSLEGFSWKPARSIPKSTGRFVLLGQQDAFQR